MTTHPIVRLRAENIAAFAHADVSFARSVNVLVGENGAGKSQMLKLLYSTAWILNQPDPLSPEGPRKTAMNSAIALKLVGVFKPESLGRLTNRRPGRTRSEVVVDFAGLRSPLAYSFASNSRTDVKVEAVPEAWIGDVPVFFPTRELLSIYPGFVALYEERALEFDETWRDTANLLGRPARRGRKEEQAGRVLAAIESAMGGTIVEEVGRFYLQVPGGGKYEMHLVAEGLRKLGMLYRLVSSGTILDSGYLFWDEPEANLNPRAIRQAAHVIVELGAYGVQVFVATHSLFLLRELEILLADRSISDPEVDTRFIGLHRTDAGVVTRFGAGVTDIGDITSLDEEITQTGRYLTSVE